MIISKIIIYILHILFYIFLFIAYGGRKIKSQYKKQPLIIRVVAFKNGNKEQFARMAAPTLKIVSSHTSP